jgi:hyaluronoglucosaminidase
MQASGTRALEWRGTIEGFYGPPWSHNDRLAHLRFAERHGLNTYVYAPKDDPFHRERWREPYPERELARLAELVHAAQAAQVRFVFTISPGLSMVYSDAAELDRLVAKLEQVWAIGVRHIGLLFDDIEPELTHDADVAVFGAAPGSSARAHASVCRHVIKAVLDRHGNDGPLLMVPTDYAGTKPSPYRQFLAQELPPEVLVWWTGHDVVVGEISRADIDEAAESYGHRLLLWDNFPVNDFDPARLFLGPLTGRTADIAGSALVGITANPMPQAAASEIALATVAEWAWDPSGYDPVAAHHRARSALAGGPAVETLIEATSSWPPSAPRQPRLSALIDDVRRQPASASDELRATFTAMIQPPEPATDDAARLVAEIRPWLDAQAAMGRAGLAALEYLRSPSPETRATAEKALAEAQAHEADVLKGIITPFVAGVLESR